MLVLHPHQRNFYAKHSEPKHMHLSLEVSTIIFGGAFFQVNVKIAASKLAELALFFKMLLFHNRMRHYLEINPILFSFPQQGGK